MNKAKSAGPVNLSAQEGKTKERYDFCAYATGLADGTSHIQVVEALNGYGSVNTFFPKQSSIRNKSGNFCYVFFKEKSCMLNAIKTKHTINGAEVTMEESEKSAKKRSLDTKDQVTQPQKRFAGSPAKTAYVGRLDPATLEYTVQKYFEKYGEIEGVVVLGKPGNSKGFGFVTFKNMSDFEKALEGKHRIGNRDIIFRRKNTPNAVDRPKPTYDNKNEVLVHLNTSITQEDFTSYFQQIGNIKSVTFPLDKKSATPKGRGYAFVSFESTKTFEKVLSSNHVINGCKILVRSANKNQQTTEAKKESSKVTKSTKEDNTKKQYTNEIMIKNLPKSCNRKVLKTTFSKYGNITNITLPHVVKDDMKSANRGFAFISFQTESSMTKALKVASTNIGGHLCQIVPAKKNEAEQKSVKKETVTEEKMEVDSEDNSDEDGESDDEMVDVGGDNAAEAVGDEEEEEEDDDEQEEEDDEQEEDDDEQEEDDEAESDDENVVEAESDDEDAVEAESDDEEEVDAESDEEVQQVDNDEDSDEVENDDEEEDEESSDEEVIIPIKKVTSRKTKKSKK